MMLDWLVGGLELVGAFIWCVCRPSRQCVATRELCAVALCVRQSHSAPKCGLLARSGMLPRRHGACAGAAEGGGGAMDSSTAEARFWARSTTADIAVIPVLPTAHGTRHAKDHGACSANRANLICNRIFARSRTPKRAKSLLEPSAVQVRHGGRFLRFWLICAEPGK